MKVSDSDPQPTNDATGDLTSGPTRTLSDGTYDVLVVDILVSDSLPNDTVDSDTADSQTAVVNAGETGSVAIEVVVTTGPQKGEVVTVEFSAAITEAEALEALGLPGTLVVKGGQPQLELDDPNDPT